DAAFLDRYSVTAPGARVPDMVEARFDLFDGVERAGTADAWLGACARLEESGTPVVVTVRPAREGGKWSGRDEDRLPLFERALGVVSWVDVEGEARSPPRWSV